MRLAKQVEVLKNVQNYKRTQNLKKEALLVEVKELVNTLRNPNVRSNSSSIEKILFLNTEKRNVGLLSLV